MSSSEARSSAESEINDVAVWRKHVNRAMAMGHVPGRARSHDGCRKSRQKVGKRARNDTKQPEPVSTETR